MTQSLAVLALTFDNTKKCLVQGLAILALNGTTILLLLSDTDNQRLALMPAALAIVLVARLCWVFGQEIRRLAALAPVSAAEAVQQPHR